MTSRPSPSSSILPAIPSAMSLHPKSRLSTSVLPRIPHQKSVLPKGFPVKTGTVAKSVAPFPSDPDKSESVRNEAALQPFQSPPILRGKGMQSFFLPQTSVHPALAPQPSMGPGLAPRLSRRLSAVPQNLTKPELLPQASVGPKMMHKTSMHPEVSRKSMMMPQPSMKLRSQAPVNSKSFAPFPKSMRSSIVPKTPTQPPASPNASVRIPMGPNASSRAPLPPNVSMRPPLLPSASMRPPLLPSASMRPPLLPNASMRPPLLPNASMRPPLLPNASMRPPLLPNASMRPPLLPNASMRPPLLPNASMRPPLLPNASMRAPLPPNTSMRAPVPPNTSMRAPMPSTATVRTPLPPNASMSTAPLSSTSRRSSLPRNSSLHMPAHPSTPVNAPLNSPINSPSASNIAMGVSLPSNAKMNPSLRPSPSIISSIRPDASVASPFRPNSSSVSFLPPNNAALPFGRPNTPTRAPVLPSAPMHSPLHSGMTMRPTMQPNASARRPIQRMDSVGPTIRSRDSLAGPSRHGSVGHEPLRSKSIARYSSIGSQHEPTTRGSFYREGSYENNLPLSVHSYETDNQNAPVYPSVKTQETLNQKVRSNDGVFLKREGDTSAVNTLQKASQQDQRRESDALAPSIARKASLTSFPEHPRPSGAKALDAKASGQHYPTYFPPHTPPQPFQQGGFPLISSTKPPGTTTDAAVKHTGSASYSNPPPQSGAPLGKPGGSIPMAHPAQGNPVYLSSGKEKSTAPLPTPEGLPAAHEVYPLLDQKKSQDGGYPIETQHSRLKAQQGPMNHIQKNYPVQPKGPPLIFETGEQSALSKDGRVMGHKKMPPLPFKRSQSSSHFLQKQIVLPSGADNANAKYSARKHPNKSSMSPTHPMRESSHADGREAHEKDVVRASHNMAISEHRNGKPSDQHSRLKHMEKPHLKHKDDNTPEGAKEKAVDDKEDADHYRDMERHGLPKKERGATPHGTKDEPRGLKHEDSCKVVGVEKSKGRVSRGSQTSPQASMDVGRALCPYATRELPISAPNVDALCLPLYVDVVPVDDVHGHGHWACGALKSSVLCKVPVNRTQFVLKATSTRSAYSASENQNAYGNGQLSRLGGAPSMDPCHYRNWTTRVPMLLKRSPFDRYFYENPCDYWEEVWGGGYACSKCIYIK